MEHNTCTVMQTLVGPLTLTRNSQPHGALCLRARHTAATTSSRYCWLRQLPHGIATDQDNERSVHAFINLINENKYADHNGLEAQSGLNRTRNWQS